MNNKYIITVLLLLIPMIIGCYIGKVLVGYILISCGIIGIAIIDVLISKTIKAAKEYKVKTVMLTGGVAANNELRKQIKQTMKNKLNNVQFIMPDLAYTTDNAVMVAVAGYFKTKRKQFTSWQKLKADCNLELLT